MPLIVRASPLKSWWKNKTRPPIRVMAAITEIKQEGGMFGSSKEP